MSQITQAPAAYAGQQPPTQSQPAPPRQWGNVPIGQPGAPMGGQWGAMQANPNSAQGTMIQPGGAPAPQPPMLSQPAQPMGGFRMPAGQFRMPGTAPAPQAGSQAGAPAGGPAQFNAYRRAGSDKMAQIDYARQHGTAFDPRGNLAWMQNPSRKERKLLARANALRGGGAAEGGGRMGGGAIQQTQMGRRGLTGR